MTNTATGVGTENGIGTPPEDDFEVTYEGPDSLKDNEDKDPVIVSDEDEEQEDETPIEDSPTDEEEDEEAIEDPIKGAFDRQKKKWQDKVKAKEDQLAWAMAELAKRNTPAEQPSVQVQSSEPTLEMFNGNIEQFTKAYTQHVTAKARAEAEWNVKVSTFQSRQNDFKKSTPDFQETLDDIADDPVARNTCREALNVIMESDVGPQMQYYFAKNLSELDKINKMTPTKALLALGKLEERLSTKSTPTAVKKITNAPTPAKPTGGAAPSKKVDLHSMTADQVEEYLEAEERKNPRLRRR
jgi:hypothetical protein